MFIGDTDDIYSKIDGKNGNYRKVVGNKIKQKFFEKVIDKLYHVELYSV